MNQASRSRAEGRRQLVQGAIAATLGLGLASGPARAQSFPDRPVRMIVPVPPGGIVDVVMRLVGREMSAQMGQNLIIDNRPGASTDLGTEIVVRARPDGYTLLSNSLPLVVNPALMPSQSFNARRDLRPISMIAAIPLVLVVHPDLPVRSVQDLIGLAKARPQAINYSSGGNGTNQHIAAALFQHLAGLKLTHVPYRGGGPALTSVLTGETQLSFLSAVAVTQLIAAGQLRALAITSSARSPLMPDLPTVAESGLPNFEFTSWVGVLAPAGTPPDIIERLHALFVAAARSPAVSERLVADGAEVIANSPEHFAAQIEADLLRWGQVVRDAGIKPD